MAGAFKPWSIKNKDGLERFAVGRRGTQLNWALRWRPWSGAP